MCFTAIAFLEETITHFPGIASDPLPFPCAHIISESSKEDTQMIRTVPTAQKRSQNSVSSGAWKHMINENFLHWERLLQSLASKTSRLYAPEPYYEL